MPQVTRKVTEPLLPVSRRQPCFQGYGAFASSRGGVISVSMFRDAASAKAANAQVGGWVQTNRLDLLPGPPEVLTGNAAIEGIQAATAVP
ncbi:hypothetical protein [Siccirubricoccus deserti]|uniref:Uncharacterized protein n=1 Tax=Siccirubricoccus deserti TaxID=2013562 RepID=A0A9X0QWJ4_9PROT|nr:hypothetical protein [Siccirubricoccus deserti]MBC4014752.1 hypothetical protein [Siccirubricoccus deserti]